MLTNGIKANWTLEECGWNLHRRGRYEDWDGLLKWFVTVMEKHPEWQKMPRYTSWYRAAKPVAEGKLAPDDIGDLQAEYDFDYRKAAPNRFTLKD